MSSEQTFPLPSPAQLLVLKEALKNTKERLADRDAQLLEAEERAQIAQAELSELRQAVSYSCTDDEMADLEKAFLKGLDGLLKTGLVVTKSQVDADKAEMQKALDEALEENRKLKDRLASETTGHRAARNLAEFNYKSWQEEKAKRAQEKACAELTADGKDERIMKLTYHLVSTRDSIKDFMAQQNEATTDLLNAFDELEQETVDETQGKSDIFSKAKSLVKGFAGKQFFRLERLRWGNNTIDAVAHSQDRTPDDIWGTHFRRLAEKRKKLGNRAFPFNR